MIGHLQIPSSIRVVAASKYVDALTIRQAYTEGLRNFGESKVQEAALKTQQLADLPDIEWHLIGQLQSNKVKLAIETFSWIHSGDRFELLQRLDRIAGEVNKKPKLCLQVKLAEDPNKAGFAKTELFELLPEINKLHNIDIQGLMTILPQGLNSAEAYKLFCELATLKNEIKQMGFSNICMNELSMGMSGDYPEAIKAGATILRIGKAIFK